MPRRTPSTVPSVPPHPAPVTGPFRERLGGWGLTWVVAPSFAPSYGVRIDCRALAPGSGRIWIVPAREDVDPTAQALHPTPAELFRRVRGEALGPDLRGPLEDLIRSLRVGLAPQGLPGCDGSTHTFALRVGAHRLEVGWWNEPEGGLLGLRPLLEVLEDLVDIEA